MKAVFAGLNDLELTMPSAPSTRYAPNEEGVNVCVRCSMRLEGNLPVNNPGEGDNLLTGIIYWKSDDDMELDQYDVANFLRYEVHNYDGTDTSSASCSLLLTNEPVPEPAPEPEPPTPEEQLAAAKAGRADTITRTRDTTIAAGVDVTTSYGVEHFTLSEKDKTLLLGIYGIISSGQVNAWPYHSINLESRSTNICTVYNEEDVAKIAVAAFGFITYHETYANMLLQWLERETDVDTVYTIVYGAQLPEDLASYMSMLLTSSGIDPSLFTPSTSEDTEESGATEPSTDEGISGTEETTPTDEETSSTEGSTPTGDETSGTEGSSEKETVEPDGQPEV